MPCLRQNCCEPYNYKKLFQHIKFYLQEKYERVVIEEAIQELKENTATIGFLDGSAERDVYIEDLYEDEFDRPKKKQF